MSIIRCFNCEHQLDSDFVQFHEHKNQDWCDSCYENSCPEAWFDPHDEKECSCPPMNECICGEDDLPYSPI